MPETQADKAQRSLTQYHAEYAQRKGCDDVAGERGEHVLENDPRLVVCGIIGREKLSKYRAQIKNGNDHEGCNGYSMTHKFQRINCH